MTRKNRSTAKSKTQGKATKRRSVPYERLTEYARDIYDQVTGLVTDVRGDKGPWPELLRKHHLSSRKARESAGRDLLGGTRGKPVRASKADRRVRDLMFPDAFRRRAHPHSQFPGRDEAVRVITTIATNSCAAS